MTLADFSVRKDRPFIDFPEDILTEQQDLRWDFVGQIAHKSRYNDRYVFVNLGLPRLTGRLHIAPVIDKEDAARIERFLLTLEGNYKVRLPLHRSTLEKNSDNSVAIVSSVNFIRGRIRCSLDRQLSEDILDKGMYIMINDRVYMVADRPNRGSMVLAPNTYIEPHSGIFQAKTVVAHMNLQEKVSLSANPDEYGPWEIPWVEEVI